MAALIEPISHMADEMTFTLCKRGYEMICTIIQKEDPASYTSCKQAGEKRHGTRHGTRKQLFLNLMAYYEP